eukprot:30802-Pelagococcus_subviridis.AAC.41
MRSVDASNASALYASSPYPNGVARTSTMLEATQYVDASMNENTQLQKTYVNNTSLWSEVSPDSMTWAGSSCTERYNVWRMTR